MIKFFKIVSLFIIVTSLLGCLDNNSDLLHKMEQIKKVGDNNPRLALNMLDSISIQVRGKSEYVQMKYDLLSLRLHDKANDIPSSDIKAITVLDYFEKKDNNLEKQEAYYYTGSVYRDLQDTPRALENFYKSVDIATNDSECDSTMLRNTYSQISYLLSDVQDYHRANEYAKKEYEIAKAIDKITTNSLMHLGVSYQCLDSLDKAKEWLDKAYYKLLESDSITDAETVYCLIYNYSRILDYKQANACYMLSKKLPENSFYYAKYKNLGTYFTLINEPDSAILCLKRVIDDNNNLYTVYDASKNLFTLYYKKGNYKEAAYYADIFCHTSETLDLGRRQELASTVNNQFQYHFDKEKEMKIKEEKEKFRFMVIIISVVSILGITLLGLLLIYRKNRNLKRLLLLSKNLDEIENSQEEMEEMIYEKERALKSSRKSYKKTNEEFESVMKKIRRISNEIEKQNKEIKNKEKELSDRIEQNRTYIKLLHQSDLEGKAEEVVEAIKQTASGKKNMKAADWKQLYKAVDELHPDFHAQLMDREGKMTEQKMQVCYLMKIGLTNLKIQNITGLSRVTVWRWLKKYDWIIR